MTHRTLLSVSLAVLLAVVTLAVAAPAVAAQEDPGDDEVNVFLDPEEAAADEGEVQEYELIVEGADQGIGAYELNVSVGDTSVAEIVDYELTAEDTDGGPFDGSQITDDGETLSLEVALGGAAHDANETAGEEFAIATVAVQAVGELNESTDLTTTSVVEGQEVATPEVGQGEIANANFYDVLNLPSQSSFLVSDEPLLSEVDLAVEPASVQSPPGAVNTYELAVYNATEGIGGYTNLSVAIEDPTVAQFVDFVETGQPTDSDSEIRGVDGSPAAAGPVVWLNATLGEGFEASDRTVIAELDIEATGDISDGTLVNVTADPAPELQEADGDEYLTDGITGSQYTVTADMDLSFDDQRYGDAAEGVTVTLRGVDSDGQQGTVVVTYEDGNETVIAGLATGTWDGESVPVVLEDLGGLSENAEGQLAGEHTAHILLTSQLSGDYAPGDTISGETAANIVEQETATVTEPDIPDLDGLDIEITEGFTVGDGYPLNQRDMFETAGSIYGLSGISLPPGAAGKDERFAPIADGQHVGLGGLPVQDEVYEWATPLVGFQTLAPTQSVAVSFDADESGPVTFDYTEVQAHGLQVADVLTVAGENIAADEYDWSLNNTAGEVVVEFDESAVGPESPTIWFELVWAAADPVEGLSVDRPNGIDYETDHRVVAEDGDLESDNFVTFEAGATGISYVDALNNANDGFIGEPADETSLDSIIDSDAAIDGEANDGSFLVWQDQVVTFETAARGDTIDIFEVAVDEDGNHTLGSEIPSSQVGFDDTAPGQVANLNTSNLTAGNKYFVTFGQNNDDAVVLDIKPLNLNADSTDELSNDAQDEIFELDVTSDDSTGGDVEAWFHYNGTDVSDVVHVERDELTGTGDRTLEIVPSVDLVGPGNYTVTVLHAESGVTTSTEFSIEEPVEPTLQPAEDVSIVSPSLLDPEQPGLFDRGDIIPVELELEGGNVATVTFGDQADQNVEIHATVYDPTFESGDESTTVTAYLNTYQIGHGFVTDEDGNLVPNRPNWIATDEWENRQHGFFTDPADAGSAILGNVTADNGMDIYGGSQGGAVISPGGVENGSYPGLRYDLHVAGSFEPHTAPGVERDDVNALDIEQRSTDSFTIWTAPGEGENALHTLDPTTMGDIESLKEQGIVTELDVETVETEDGTRLVHNGTISENDYLIVEADSSGLEGVMHEAVVRNDTLAVDEFLDRSDDHLVTAEFMAAVNATVPRIGDPMLDYNVQFFENTTTYADRIGEPVENVEQIQPDQVVLDLFAEMDRVLGGTDTEGNLQEYVVPYQLQPGDDLLDETLVDPDLATLEGGLTFDTGFALEPSGGEQANVDETWDDRNVPTSVNPALESGSLGLQNVDELDYVTPVVSIDDVHLGPAGLEVPGEDNYTITGTSTMAPGTTLDLEMISETGEGTPFFREFTSIETVAQPGDAPATWEVSVDFSETRDNVTIQSGTEFVTDVTRAGPSSGIGGGEAIPGVVLADPAVGTFTVNDQRSDGDVVVVEAFEANRIAQIEIQDADGNVLGTSEVLDRSAHEQFNVVLDDLVEENQAVTAVATIVKPEAGEVLEEQSAEILVEDESEAFFSVTDLTPQLATVEQGETVEVSATVENLGDLEGTQTVQLDIDGITDSEDLTLAGGDSDTVSFTVDTSEVSAGDYTHSISSDNGSVAGALTVEEPPSPAAFQVVSLSPAEATATQGDTVTVDVAVQNTGDQEGTQTVTLSIDGINMTQDLTLASGDAGSVSFSVDTSDVDVGDYTHTVSTDNDSSEGSLGIEEPEPSDETNVTDDEDDADGDGAGFGIVVAALALLGAALLAMRRQVE